MSEIRKKSIVITGTGLACGLGLDAETAWRNVLAGRRGIGPMPAMESPLPPGSDGGQALDLPTDFSPQLPREARYLRWAITQAATRANLPDAARPRTAVVLGTTLHGMRAAGRFLRSNDFAELKDFLAGDVVAHATAGLGFGGGAVTTCSACSSGLGAIALGVTLLNTGEADAVIAGGYDPVSEYAWAGFNSLRLVSGPPLRPFAAGRCGMKLAEAYAVVVLERDVDVRSRSAKTIATVAGYGESADAHHLTQPHPAGIGAAAAMRQAIARAGLSSADVGLAAAHATGTPDNDAAEFAAMDDLFGDRLPAVPVAAFKSHLGHTLGGAGAIELIFSAMALRDGLLPPTVLAETESVEFASLALTRGAPKPATLRATLNTSLGFGGANTSIVLTPGFVAAKPDSLCWPTTILSGQYDDTARIAKAVAATAALRAVVITGVGVVLPGVYDRAALESPGSASGRIDMARVERLLNARRVRRMSDYVKLTLAAATLAAREAFGDAACVPHDTAALLGTTHGSAGFSETYYRQIIAEGVAAANPILFAEGVPNAAAAQLSLMLGLTGPCQTLVGTHTAGLDALRLAFLRVSGGEWERAIVSAGEEDSALVADAYARCDAGPADNTAGAAALVIESAESASARGAVVLATVTHAAVAAGPGIDALVRVLRALPAADHIAGDGSRSAGIAARRAERRESAIDDGFGRRFSVTPLASLAAAIVGAGGATVVCGDDPSGLATGVRIQTLAALPKP